MVEILVEILHFEMKMYSHKLLVDLSHSFWLMVIKQDLTQNLTIAIIDRRFVLVFRLLHHCGWLVVHKKMMVVSKMSGIERKIHHYYGNMNGDSPGPSSMKTSFHSSMMFFQMHWVEKMLTRER